MHTIPHSDTIYTTAFGAGIKIFHMANDDASEPQIIKAENCPKDLKKRLKMKALERDMDLQDLILEYCEKGLEKDDADKIKKRKA